MKSHLADVKLSLLADVGIGVEGQREEGRELLQVHLAVQKMLVSGDVDGKWESKLTMQNSVLWVMAKGKGLKFCHNLVTQHVLDALVTFALPQLAGNRQ